jgi:hypothetical protein
MNRCYKFLVFSSMITLAFPLVALAVQYDPPTIESYVQGHAKVVTVVTAGASGAPAGFRVQWMKLSDYQANGNQWYPAANEVQSEAIFMGQPTLNTWSGQLTSFCLEPNAEAAVEIGDLFDETGLSTSTAAVLELAAETQYVFRACANGDGAADESDWTPTAVLFTERNRNCTNGRMYWRNHPGIWRPVLSLTLGNVTYTKSQLLDILDEQAEGNGLLMLAHQIIAVELNLSHGADPKDVEDALAEAHLLVGSLVVPPIGSAYVDPEITSPVTQVMDDYNNGVIGPGHCPPISTSSASWSYVKALYR